MLPERPEAFNAPERPELLLDKLHCLDTSCLNAKQRRDMADLLPLAIVHCESSLARRLVANLVREIRGQWEAPSFLSGRGRFKENDPVSHAEAMLFFSFWAGRIGAIEEILRNLALASRLRPHHLSDAVFSLIELGAWQRAKRLLQDFEAGLRRAACLQHRALTNTCEAAIAAAAGDPEAAERFLFAVDPDPTDRAYNVARLRLARAYGKAGSPQKALRALRSLGTGDGFAREQGAWMFLWLGDADQAEKQLRPFVERGEYRSGRNLSNFLHGLTLFLRGRQDAAMQVFSCLESVPWPRTWTLGSHYAAGRLGRGDLQAYLSGAFPWEQAHLRNQVELFERVGGKPARWESGRG